MKPEKNNLNKNLEHLGVYGFLFYIMPVLIISAIFIIIIKIYLPVVDTAMETSMTDNLGIWVIGLILTMCLYVYYYRNTFNKIKNYIIDNYTKRK